MMLIISQSRDCAYNLDNIISIYVEYNNTALTPDRRKYYVMAETVKGMEVLAEYGSRRQAMDELYEIGIKQARGESPHVLREDKGEET